MTVDEWNKGCRPNSLPKQKLNFNAVPTLESEYTVHCLIGLPFNQGNQCDLSLEMLRVLGLWTSFSC